MLKSLKLQNVGPAPQMDIEFADRLNVITGDNGLGKSFLLDIAWWVLTRTWASLPIRPNTVFDEVSAVKFSYENNDCLFMHDKEEEGWVDRGNALSSNSLIIYAKTEGSFAIWEPYRYRRMFRNLRVFLTSRLDPYQQYNFNLLSPSEIWNGITQDDRSICNGLINDWSSWQKEKGESLATLVRVLKCLSPSKDELLLPGKLTRISLDDVRDIPSLKMPYGQEIPVLVASTAIKRILSFAYLLVWAWQEHKKAAQLLGLPEPKDTSVIFLIDEVENHLHPRWQRRIFRALLEVMNALSESDGVKVQIIATTHSPLILASLEPLFDETQDALFDLDLVKGETDPTPHVEIHKLPWRKRGEAGNWATSEAIGLKSFRSLEAETVLEKANAAMNSPSFDATEARKLDAELRQLLSDTDPFWMRWRFIGEKQGWLQ